jgi:hypothetical protein
MYKNVHAVQQHSHEARDWFVVWMGLLSHLIAVGNTKQHNVALSLAPWWFTALEEIDFEQDWLSVIYSLTIGDFSVDTHCAGVFVNLINPAQCQPPIDWFIHHNVPVWYPWGTREMNHAEQDPVFVQSFAPPAEAFRSSSPLFLPSSLSTPPRCSSPPTFFDPIKNNTIMAKSPTPKHKQPTYQTWEEFFALQSLFNAKAEKLETPLTWQQCLNHLRKPPTVNTKVFIWVQSLKPNVPPHQLYCERVSKKFNEDTIGDYGEAQQHYGAFHNEWDLCEEFGPDDDNLGDDKDNSYSYSGFDSSSHPLEPLDVLHHSVSPSPADFHDDAWVPNKSNTDLLRIFADHFGFVPPLKSSSHKTPVTEKAWNQCLCVAGLIKEPGDNPILSFDHIIVSFINSLAEGKHPAEDEWDIHPHNQLSVIRSEHFEHIHVVSPQIFIVDFPLSSGSLPWKLAVRNAADALYICRLDVHLSKYQVAFHLVEHGIPFRTLLPLHLMPLVPRSFSNIPILPIRLTGYQFTQKDYLVYKKHCASILSSQCGCAACKGLLKCRCCTSRSFTSSNSS